MAKVQANTPKRDTRPRQKLQSCELHIYKTANIHSLDIVRFGNRQKLTLDSMDMLVLSHAKAEECTLITNEPSILNYEAVAPMVDWESW